MDPVFIDRLEAKNYGCLYDVTLQLTPLHALVGPNDSGKSTILRAIRTTLDMIRPPDRWHQTVAIPHSGFEPDRNPRLKLKIGNLGLELTGAPPTQWQVRVALPGHEATMGSAGDLHGIDVRQLNTPGVFLELQKMGSVLRGAQLLRLDPDSLRLESGLIPESQPVRFSDDRGQRLAGIYDAIRNRGDDAFQRIAEDVRRFFPTVKAIRLRNVDDRTKALEIELADGARVEARFMSEGLLYYLAFAALQYLERPAVILVEEPENGLHPIRIAEVTRMLREISKTTQVIVATHSPLVVNELSPDEVSIVTRTPEKGTSVRPLSTAANFADRAKVYSLGELWLSYANGIDESALFAARPAP